jgi:hypothetical protein
MNTQLGTTLALCTPRPVHATLTGAQCPAAMNMACATTLAAAASADIDLTRGTVLDQCTTFAPKMRGMGLTRPFQYSTCTKLDFFAGQFDTPTLCHGDYTIWTYGDIPLLSVHNVTFFVFLFIQYTHTTPQCSCGSFSSTISDKRATINASSLAENRFCRKTRHNSSLPDI